MALPSPYDDAPMPAADDADDMGKDTDEDEGDDSLPPEFKTAYEAYESEPSAKTFWDAVEACTGNKGGGLLAILGKSKSPK